MSDTLETDAAIEEPLSSYGLKRLIEISQKLERERNTFKAALMEIDKLTEEEDIFDSFDSIASIAHNALIKKYP